VSVEPLATEERDAIRNAIIRDGKKRVCELLGVSKQTLANAVSGFPVQSGSISLIRSNLSRVRDSAD